MIQIDPAFVARALNLPARTGAPFTAVVTDSRKIQPGCLFVALKGEKFDGHDFIDQAVAQGASAVLCAERGKAETMYFQVADAQDAYRKLGAAWRREFRIPVVAVAGSVGKTTTKEILTAILRGRWPKVLKTIGSQNGFVGIPMTLLDLRPDHGAAVIEVGIDEIGAMAQHMPIVEPTVAVLTAIGPEHLEKLVDVPTVAREEAICLQYVARQGGIVAIHLDDEWIRPLQGQLPGQRITYSLEGRKADVSAKVEGDAVTIDGEKYALPLPGAHNAGNFLSAFAVARALGLSPSEIRRGLETFEPPQGRSQIRKLSNGMTAVCDYYNANPTSTEAGLKLLTQVAAGAPRWACLADMKELGPDEERFHRELARPIAQLGIEHVLLHGSRMEWLADELGKRGYKGTLEQHASPAELGRALAAHARAGDALLFKGSNSMKMVEAWNAFAETTGLAPKEAVK